ncbi:MAG: preprotein translocase subunit SecE [Caldiserica bacterium]|nr:preprotein translocase subunit SecE [Caldisericota bacterium]
MIQKIKDYFRAVIAEAKKVSWPSWQQVAAFTALILIMVVALAIYLGLVDTVVKAILSALLKR